MEEEHETAFEAAIEELPEAYRIVNWLDYTAGLSMLRYSTLDIPMGTVKEWVRQSKRKISCQLTRLIGIYENRTKKLISAF